MQRVAVDSSILIAIMNAEPEADLLQAALDCSIRVIGWPTVFETRIWVARRRRPEFAKWLDAFLELDQTICIPFDAVHDRLAHRGFRIYGKGRHPASLNFGDCMTYAIATADNLPLLFKGGDFGKTDIAVHPASVIIVSADI